MRKWGATSILIIILLILTLLGAVNYFATPLKRWQMSNEQKEAVVVQNLVNDELDKDESEPTRLVDSMTISEQVWQVLAVPIDITDMAIDRSLLLESQSATDSTVSPASSKTMFLTDALDSSLPATSPGTFIIFGDRISTESASQFSQLIDSYYATSSAQPWLAVDHEGGTVQRLSGQGFTTLPSWQKICQSLPSAQIELASQTALELEDVGIDLVLAPVIDVATQGAILGSRVCSGDPDQVASVSATFINSFLQAGILPVVKHYPGIGGVNVDLHNQFGSSAIQSTDVKPFHALLSQFPLIGAMTAHVGPEENSQEICSRSYACVSELTSLYPKALVISDALDMKSALFNPESQAYDTPMPQATLEALLAGNDLLLFGPSVSLEDISKIADYLIFAANQDPAIQARIEVAAEKILSYKELYQ